MKKCVCVCVCVCPQPLPQFRTDQGTHSTKSPHTTPQGGGGEHEGGGEGGLPGLTHMCQARGPQAPPTPHGMVPPQGAQTSAFHHFFQGVGVLGGSEHKVAAISASQGCSGPQAPSNWGMHMHAYARICMHMHAFACTCMHLHAYVCISMHMHAYACICMHLRRLSRPGLGTIPWGVGGGPGTGDGGSYILISQTLCYADLLGNPCCDARPDRRQRRGPCQRAVQGQGVRTCQRVGVGHWTGIARLLL